MYKRQGCPNFKSLVLSSQTTKLHLILRVCPEFQGLACLVKPNYKTTPYFERVPKFQESCLVKPNYKTTPDFARVSKISRFGLSCQAKLQNYTLFWVGPLKFQDVLSCQAKLQNYILFWGTLSCFVKPYVNFNSKLSFQAKLQNYTCFFKDIQNIFGWTYIRYVLH